MKSTSYTPPAASTADGQWALGDELIQIVSPGE